MEIRPAATLVLVRDTADGLEVLLLQRTWDAVFMPGYFVFPGGRVEEDETHGQDHIVGPGDAEISQTMSVDEGGADFMLAAVRECFEESGVLVAVDKQGLPIAGDHPVHADRKSVFDGESMRKAWVGDSPGPAGLSGPLDYATGTTKAF